MPSPGAHELVFLQDRLDSGTAQLAAAARPWRPSSTMISVPRAGAAVGAGRAFVTTRSTGFNHIDIQAARRLGITVARVADYSPYSVAEFAVGLLLAVNRKIARASMRTREGNFELEGLMGFDLHGKTVGVIGTGKIGALFARIMAGFGCTVLGSDVHRNPEFEALGGRYVSRDGLFAASDVISLHCPLTEATRYLVNAQTLAGTKPGCILVNTSRGGLVDTEAAIAAFKSGQLRGLAIDVYEQEASLFFQDLSRPSSPTT
jgi:D-lactate dehydrogenase